MPRGGTAKKKSRPQPASSKRHKPTLRSTPFVSLQTGEEFLYDEGSYDSHNYIKCSPCGGVTELQMETAATIAAFLRHEVRRFATEVLDVILGPDCLVVIYILDDKNFPSYEAFLKDPARIRVPNTEVTLFVETTWLEQLLEEYEMDGYTDEDKDLMDILEPDDLPPWEDSPPPKKASKTKATQPSKTTAPSPSTSKASRTTAPSPATTKATLPAKTTATSPATTTAPSPAMTKASQPATTTAPPPALTKAPPPEPSIATPAPVQPAPPASAQPVTSSQPAQPSQESSSGSALDPAFAMDTQTTSTCDDQVITPTVTVSRPIAQPRRKVRFRAVDFSSLSVEVPAQPESLTVIIRPTNKADNLSKAHPKLVMDELVRLGGADYHGIRDIRDGGLAVDFPAGTDPAQLLSLSLLAGIAVTCALPASTAICAAVLSGVNPLLSTEEIAAALVTVPCVKVLSVKRLARPGQESWTVKVTFDGVSIPEKGLLFGRSRPFKRYVDKPLQCIQCGRYGHTQRVCRSSQRCWICSGPHAKGDCPNLEKPACPNCGGAHTADAPTCQTRAFQAKVCEVRATNRVSHKIARQAVTASAKTYADVARAKKTSTQPPTPNFKPNVAHPRPPTVPDRTQLASLVQGLISALPAAISSGDFTSILQQLACLLLSLTTDTPSAAQP